MGWLFVKDLRILRHSPLISALLVLYPVAIAVLIGLALSGGPSDPRVAFLNQIPEGEEVAVGGSEIDPVSARSEFCGRVECVDVESVDEAVTKVEEGDVLAAVVLPPEFADQIQSLGGLTPQQPTVDVYVNEEDPVKAQLVEDRIQSLITEANLIVSRQISETAADYLDLLLEGGEFDFLGQSLEILGLRESQGILEEIQGEIEEPAVRNALDPVVEFARLARENLDFAIPILGAVAEPIQVSERAVSGDAPGLDTFAISIAATFTLMFVTVLLVAGSLALEREENTFSRLVRGLVSRAELLAEKILLGIAVALVVTLVMLLGLELFVSLDWGRFPLWIPAVIGGGAGFAAFGAAIGAAAREVRAASLLAFMLSLPIAFLSLIPSGTVGATLFDVVEITRAAFPFDPSLDAIDGALDASGPGLGVPLIHLAVLTVAYGLLARVALRRFG
jgi:ABC-type transport system involved in cytochrome c biogenesis permease component